MDPNNDSQNQVPPTPPPTTTPPSPSAPEQSAQPTQPSQPSQPEYPQLLQPATDQLVMPDQPVVIQPTNPPANPVNTTAPTVYPMVTPTAGPGAAPMDPAAPKPAVFAPDTQFHQAAGVMAGGAPVFATPPKKKFPVLAIAGIAGVFLTAVLGSAFYFGYWNNDSVIYSQAMKNTGKGITELTNQLTEKSSADYKGYTGNGSYKVESDMFSTDGKFAFKANKDNAETTFDIGLGVTRLDFDIRSLKSAGTSPDLYFKVNGITGLGSMLGPEYGAVGDKYNDRWIVVDHTLIDNAQKQLAQSESASPEPPTNDQITDEIAAFSKVNEEYIFTANEDKAVIKVLETYGKKTVDGNNVVHYKVGYNKANVKKYITAQKDALKASKLNDWIKKNNYTEQVDTAHKDLLDSADDIKSSDTFEIYADVKSRVIYKVRFSDPENKATNYVDFGLDNIKDDNLPFFIAGKSKDGEATTDFTFKLNANTKTNVVTAKLTADATSASTSKITADFTFKPSNVDIKIEAPADAVQIVQVLQEVGVGDPFGAVPAIGETLGVSTSKPPAPAPKTTAPARKF